MNDTKLLDPLEKDDGEKQVRMRRQTKEQKKWMRRENLKEIKLN